jgi:hypothetical protein
MATINPESDLIKEHICENCGYVFQYVDDNRDYYTYKSNSEMIKAYFLSCANCDHVNMIEFI